MFKIIELEIDPSLSGETGVFEVAWVEYPAIEQDMMVFSKQSFFKAPDYVSEYACRAIKENEKRGNPAGTQVGKVRAQQLCQKQDISLETIKRMKSFLERAETYNSGDWDDNGTIAYGLWGGPDALTWVDKILRQEEDFGYTENEEFVYPNAGEEESDFISRCVKVVIAEGKSQDQALGQCYGMWENREFAEVGPRGGIRESKKAPKSDTKNPNPKGQNTAKGDASGKRGAEVSAEQEKSLQKKVDDFNEKESNTKNGNATLGSLKSVFQRGLGAYNTSRSPNVRSAEQWAMARVNAYLYLLKNGRPERKAYVQDNDLLPNKHPKATKMSKEDFAFEKVSFEYDDILNTTEGLNAFKREIGFGNFVYIVSKAPFVTPRMRELMNEYRIPQDRIFATGSDVAKVRKIKELGIVRHYDSSPLVKLTLPQQTILFDYDVSAIGGYVDYPESGSTNSMLVEPTDFDCGCDLQKSNTYFEMEDMDIFGYKAQHFEICPGAIALFGHLVEMNPDLDTQGMIRSAAQIADNVFLIEKDVIKKGKADESELKQAMILVDDFKDLMGEIDNLVGMDHDVSFMDGHISVIEDYLDEDGEFNQEFRKTLLELKKTDTQKFEAVTGILLSGMSEAEAKQANFRDGQKLYRYSNFFPGILDTREFCASIEEKYFRRSTIDLLRDINVEFGHNRQPYSKWLYKGGPECVHAFVEYEVRRRRGTDGDLITDIIRIGPVPGLPGTPPRSMPLQGYYSEETRAKSKRAYAIERSQAGFSATLMDDSQVKKCFGDLCQVGFSKSKDQMFAAVEEKRMLYTPLMIPGILIPRIDEVTREKYYVKFTPETVSRISKKFAMEGRNRMTNYEHSDQKFKDIVMVESWIVEGENDKAYELGFTKEQVPVGTWMGGYYVLETPEGEDVWHNYIKNGKVRGASVEGNFILNFSALKDDDYLLGQIINILKNITE